MHFNLIYLFFLFFFFFFLCVVFVVNNSVDNRDRSAISTEVWYSEKNMYGLCRQLRLSLTQVNRETAICQCVLRMGFLQQTQVINSFERQNQLRANQQLQVHESLCQSLNPWKNSAESLYHLCVFYWYSFPRDQKGGEKNSCFLGGQGRGYQTGLQQ